MIINKFSGENFDTLERAKEYYCNISYLLREDYLGSDYEDYINRYFDWVKALTFAKSEEVFCDIWKNGTDEFENGSELIIE